VPLIVRWPEKGGRGRVCKVPVNTVDLCPTFLDLAGATREGRHVLDGETLVPLLKGRKGLKRDALYWHYPLAKPHFLGGRSSGAIRKGDYKLVEFYDTGQTELYNLKADPGERQNRTPTMPGKVLELRKLLEKWRDNVGARSSGGSGG